MQILKRVFAAVAVLAAGVYAGDGAVEDSAVVTLTTETFQSFIDSNPVALVEFYAPWCGHCKKLAPEYEAAAKQLKERGGVPLAKVDATAEKELATRYNIQGFPTLHLFRKGEAEAYDGGRSSRAIVDWLDMNTGPAVTLVESYDVALEKAGKLSSTVYIGRITGKDTEAYEILEKAADVSRNLGKFIVVLEDGAGNVVEVHRKGEEAGKTPLDKAERVQGWLKAEAFPLFGPVSGENFSKYSERSDSWVWVAGSADDYETVGPAVRKVSKSYREEYNFVFLDTKQFAQHAENLGLKEYPSIAIQSTAGRFVYRGDITEKGLTKFIEAVRAGKVERDLKSEAIPEKNEGPVIVVVGKTFEEIVLDKSKDVLLEVYAPWCGHCKAVQPIYEEFATAVKENSHLVIAKMDGTANEVPVEGFDFHGFPTIFFVKAGETKAKPYNEARTLEGFTAFIKEHSSKPVSIVGVSKDEL